MIPTQLHWHHWGRLLACLFSFLLFFSFQDNNQSNQNPAATDPSQFEQDTLAARVLYSQGRRLSGQLKYDSALIAIKAAVALYEPYVEEGRDTFFWKTYLDFTNDLGYAYICVYAFDKSKAVLLDALEAGKKHLGETHTIVAGCYYHLGGVYYYQKDYHQSLIHYKLALDIDIQNLGPGHFNIGGSYINIAGVYTDLGAYEEALRYYRKGIAVLQANQDELSKTNLPVALMQEGAVFVKMGNLELAKERFFSSLKHLEALYGEKHAMISYCHNNLASVYRSQGAYNEALDHYQKALSNWMEVIGQHRNETITMVNNQSIIYLKKGHYEKALAVNGEAIAIAQHLLKPSDILFGNLYFTDGAIYKSMKRSEKALERYRKALAIFKTNEGEHGLSVARTYNNIGMVFLEQSQYDDALVNFQQFLGILETSWKESRLELAKAYNNIGAAFWGKGDYENALSHLQEAIDANAIGAENLSFEGKPTSEQKNLSDLVLLRTHLEKGRVLFDKYRNAGPKEITSLYSANQTYQQAIETIDRIKQGFQNQEDKSTLLETAYPIYEGAIRIAQELHEHTQLDSFLYQAFTIFEKSRSMLLLEELQNNRAKKFAGLPAELLDSEEDIAIRLAFYEQSLFEEELKEEAADSTKMALWQDKVFNLRQTKDSITQVLEKEYPEYYRLKYDVGVASIGDVQKLLSDNNSAVLEYFVGDSSIYAFLISKESYHCLEAKKEFPLEEWVEGLRESVYGYHLAENRSEDLYKASTDSLVEISHLLYQKLFAPMADAYSLPERLIISPDGVLGYLPFELLLTELPADNYAFGSHAYLLKQHQISYAYSSTLLQELQERPSGKAQGTFAAFAPSFQEEEVLASREVEGLRTGLGPLQYNIPEVEALQTLMGGEAITGAAATEERFVEEAPNYRILHLATHGKANDRLGDYCYLAFSEIPDSIENERLYNRDLYNLRLNADMVVLSACETGLGELQRGEGIISLARGFSYAGARSLATSLWAVDDAKTKELMEGFYTHIKAGLPKDEALHRAKLAYLESNNARHAHPFFWAGFILMGDAAPVEWGSGLSWWWLGLAALGLIILALVLRRHR